MRQSRLLDLIRANFDRPREFRIAADAGAEEATIYLYGAIDQNWGIAAQDFVKALVAITAPTIHLRINSPGGDVFEARAIATAIRAHGAKIIAHVDGLAASAASYVATAAREVEMAPGAFFMVHNAWAIAIGNSDEMLTMADLLDKIDGTIAADYAAKTGKSAQDTAAWMAAETWFTAQEAIDAGLADRVAALPEHATEQAATSARMWDLAAYRNAPKKLTEAPPAPTHPDRDALERRLALYDRIAA